MYSVFDHLQSLCQPYHDLATSYSTSNPTELRNTLSKHTAVFTRVSVQLLPLKFFVNDYVILYNLSLNQIIHLLISLGVGNVISNLHRD